MWPFTSSAPPSEPAKHKTEKRERSYVTIDIEAVPGGKIIGGTAFFQGEPATTIKAEVPIDALGELVLKHPERLGFELIDQNIRPLPTAKDAKRKQLYLTVAEEPDHRWVAMLGGLNLILPALHLSAQQR